MGVWFSYPVDLVEVLYGAEDRTKLTSELVYSIILANIVLETAQMDLIFNVTTGYWEVYYNINSRPMACPVSLYDLNSEEREERVLPQEPAFR